MQLQANNWAVPSNAPSCLRNTTKWRYQYFRIVLGTEKKELVNKLHSKGTLTIPVITDAIASSTVNLSLHFCVHCAIDAISPVVQEFSGKYRVQKQRECTLISTFRTYTDNYTNEWHLSFFLYYYPAKQRGQMKYKSTQFHWVIWRSGGESK